VVQVSFERGQRYVHSLLIGVFIALTTPVPPIFLMRAAVFRARMRGTDIPAPADTLPGEAATGGAPGGDSER
jgi:multicomponent K+:H+ antiporter subunit G